MMLYGTAWLTLGMGRTPAAIVTDDRGTGRAALFRTLTSPLGTTFDIHFRVIEQATGTAMLESACYQFVVSSKTLRSGSVALLELLAAAAGARIVAAHAGIGIRDECRLGDPRLTALD